MAGQAGSVSQRPQPGDLCAEGRQGGLRAGLGGQGTFTNKKNRRFLIQTL